MTNLNKVVSSLRSEYSRLEKEMGRVGKALDALGHAGGKSLKRTGRTLSKEARKRIADAQRLRWAKVRKQAAKLVKSLLKSFRNHRKRPRSQLYLRGADGAFRGPPCPNLEILGSGSKPLPRRARRHTKEALTNQVLRDPSCPWWFHDFSLLSLRPAKPL